MKKYFIFLYIFFTCILFSEELELIKNFAIGNGEGELSIAEPWMLEEPDKDGPNGMVFDSDGNLLILDTWNDRIVVFSINTGLSQIINIDNGNDYLRNRFIQYQDFISAEYQKVIYSCVDLNGNLIYQYNFHHSNLVSGEELQFHSYINYNGYFFYKTTNDQLFCIPSPKNEEERFDVDRMIWNDDVYNMFDSDSEYDVGNLTLDEDGFFFDVTEPILYNYQDFTAYWMRDLGIDNQTYRDSLIHSDRPPSSDSQSTFYMGKDFSGNYYWCMSGRKVFVFNRTGSVISAFLIDRSKSYFTPAVSSEGDIYFFEYNQNGHRIYKMKRGW